MAAPAEDTEEYHIDGRANLTVPDAAKFINRNYLYQACGNLAESGGHGRVHTEDMFPYDHAILEKARKSINLDNKDVIQMAIGELNIIIDKFQWVYDPSILRQVVNEVFEGNNRRKNNFEALKTHIDNVIDECVKLKDKAAMALERIDSFNKASKGDTSNLKTKDAKQHFKASFGKQLLSHQTPFSKHINTEVLDFNIFKKEVIIYFNLYFPQSEFIKLEESMEGVRNLSFDDGKLSILLMQVLSPHFTLSTRNYISGVNPFNILDFIAQIAFSFKSLAPEYLRDYELERSKLLEFPEQLNSLRKYSEITNRMRALGRDITSKDEANGLWFLLPGSNWKMQKKLMPIADQEDPIAIIALASSVITSDNIARRAAKPKSKQGPPRGGAKANAVQGEIKRKAQRKIPIGDNKKQRQGNSKVAKKICHVCNKGFHDAAKCDARPNNPHKWGSCVHCFGRHATDDCYVPKPFQQRAYETNQRSNSNDKPNGKNAKANRAAGARAVKLEDYDSSDSDDA